MVPRVKVLDGDSTLHDVVMVVSPGRCRDSLDLGIKHQGMISGVRSFGQAGAYRPVSVLRRSGLMTVTGLVVLYSRLRRSAPPVPRNPGSSPLGLNLWVVVTTD